MPVRASRRLSKDAWHHYVPAFILVTTIVFAVFRVSVLDRRDPHHCHALISQGQWLDTKFTNWQPKGCMMHKYTPPEVQYCLRSKRVVFIGDSTTRQLFFSMAQLADPTLPSSPPSSFEKHSDHSLPAGTGTWFDFFWDPFLNSTKTETLLKGDGFGKRDAPNMLVLGTGLWFLRYRNEPGGGGGMAGWESRMEHIIETIRNSKSKLADEIIILPVQEPDPNKLSAERSAFIQHADIDAMNSDLLHRLSPLASVYDPPTSTPPSHLPIAPTTIPEDVVLHSADHGRAPAIFPSVFNTLLDPSQTADGLHYSPLIASSQAQILLNLRCNDLQPKRFPFDKTCCARYPARLDLSLWVSVGIWLFGPMIWFLRLREKESGVIAETARTILPLLPEAKYDKPLTIFGSVVWLCRIADRTGLWLKSQKQFNPWIFTMLSVLIIVACLATVKKGSKDLGPLNRQQTDEWKGWMQLFILIYHYMGASRIAGIYAPIRVLVASYLFMTGYGHTMYYLRKADFSILRVAQVLVRLNLLTIILAYTMDTDYIFYYFAPLVSFWYLVVYFTLLGASSHNTKPIFVLCKIIASFLVVAIIHSQVWLIEGVFRLLRTLANINWSPKEWAFRVNLDYLIVYVGMTIALVLHTLDSPGSAGVGTARLVDHRRWSWLRHTLLLASFIGLVWFAAFELSRKDKFAYNLWHPYVSVVPVLGFIALRNATPVLRSASSWLAAWIGACSLETFILQYHLWLAADTKGLLVIIPGINHREINLIITSTVFLWLSHLVATATGDLTKLLCGVESPTPTLPLTSNETTISHSIPDSVAQSMSSFVNGTQAGDTESIPLAIINQAGSIDNAAAKSYAEDSEFTNLLSREEQTVPNEPPPSSPPTGAAANSHGKSDSSEPWPLPVRVGVILVVLWILNLVWPPPTDGSTLTTYPV